MKILTIIVSYNFEPWLNKCLNSLKASALPTDVIVVDNASKDQTTRRIKEEYPDINLISNEENLGFGQANNIGLRKAVAENYDAVFLLNQDAWIAPHTLEKLTDAMQKNPQAGVISPVHLNGQGGDLDQGFAKYIQCSDKAHLPQTSDAIEAQFINAAFWLIPIEKLKAVGGFSPLFYHYGEDIDYVNRLHKKGLKILYVPNAFGCHDREFRKNTRESYLRSEQVYLLSEYANINYSFGKSFAYSILAGIKKGFKDLALFSITWKLLLSTPQVIKRRKEALQNECFI